MDDYGKRLSKVPVLVKLTNSKQVNLPPMFVLLRQHRLYLHLEHKLHLRRWGHFEYLRVLFLHLVVLLHLGNGIAKGVGSESIHMQIKSVSPGKSGSCPAGTYHFECLLDVKFFGA